MTNFYSNKLEKSKFQQCIQRNPLRTKFELIKDTFDIFLLSESKLDSSFPDDQFSIDRYRVVRKDPNRDGKRLLWFINEDISFKVIQSSSLLITLEVLPIEINLGDWCYKWPSNSEKDFLLHISNAYTFSPKNYDYITLIGDLNMQPENKNLKDHCDSDRLEHVILKPTCYRAKTPSTIDLIKTNHKTQFMKSDNCETGL